MWPAGLNSCVALSQHLPRRHCTSLNTAWTILPLKPGASAPVLMNTASPARLPLTGRQKLLDTASSSENAANAAERSATLSGTIETTSPPNATLSVTMPPVVTSAETRIRPDWS